MSDFDVSDLITVERAIQIIDSTPITLQSSETAMEGSYGCRLAKDLHADRDYPPFDKSLMDGFAIRAADASSPLRVVGEIAAGGSPSRRLVEGEAVAVMTGAPLPAGADSVVPIEHTRREGDFVRIDKPVKRGQSIAKCGSDCAAGDVVLKAGTRMGSAQLAVAASVGATRVSVYAPPRVAVLSTGDEIVPIDQVPGPSQIRNS